MYASLEALRDFTGLSDTPENNAKLTKAELMARLFIDSVCGQKFDSTVGTEIVAGQDERSLSLPKRLNSLTSIGWGNTSYNIDAFLIRGDGWYLTRPAYSILTIKEMPPEDAIPVVYQSYGPIFVPGRGYGTFHSNTNYAITGTWGWAEVPEDIVMATLLLVNDYLCGDFVYILKGVSAVRTADGTMEFKNTTISGNFIVDQLLSNYKVFPLAVV